MKKLLLALLAAVVLTTGVSRCVAAEGAGAVPVNQLTVMTLNLRVANETDKYPWSKRKIAVRDFLKARQPDVFGTQEGVFQQLRDVIGTESDYAWLGEGREGGTQGEFMAIFYRKDRFVPMEFDSCWLSETPEVVASKSWKTACTRMVTWARFVDTETGKQFYFVDTHLDHISQEARVNGAKLICSVINKLDKSLPVFLTGDFNIDAGNEAVHDQFVEAGLFDTWDAPDQKRSKLYKTFNDFKAPKEGGDRIDWIFTRPQVKVLSTEIVLNAPGAVYVSDHFPVVSVVQMPW